MQKLYLRFIYCILFCCITFTKSQLRPVDTFRIKGANSDLVNPFLLVIEDKNNNLNVNQVLKKYHQEDYKKDNNRVYNSKYTRSSFWFLLPIKNVGNEQLSLIWSFYNNNFGLDFYDISNLNNPKLSTQIKSQDDLSKRPFASRSVAFPFKLKPSETQFILVKIYPENTNLIYFLSDVSTTEDVLFWENNYALTVGKYIGYTLFIFWLNIFLFFVLRQKIHFWHALYILSIILFSLNENMMDIYYFGPKIYSIFGLFPKMFWLLISLCFCIIVFQKFTEQKRKFPKLYRILKVFSRCSTVIILAIIIAAFTLPFQSYLFFVLRLAIDVLLVFGTSFLFFCTMYASFKKDRQSLAFAISTAFLLAAFINYILDANFRINLYYIQPGNILIGLVIEITILTALFIWQIAEKSRRSQTKYILQNLENQMLTKRLLKIQEEERNSIAREIHDGIGSLISGLKVNLQNIFNQKTPPDDLKKNEIISQVSTIYQDLRFISHQLLPSYVEENNLIDLLKTRIDIYLKNDPSVAITLQQNIYNLELEQQNKLHIYRIITELLDNALKHSDCKEINIQIYSETAVLDIMIEDDGKGYNIMEKHQGIGLRSVQSRIAFLKGKQVVESNSYGTTYIISLPI